MVASMGKYWHSTQSDQCPPTRKHFFKWHFLLLVYIITYIMTDLLAFWHSTIYNITYSFSRYLLWLKLGTTNRKPEQICSYFMEAVNTECLPHSIRVDAGTENKNILHAMQFLSDGLPCITPHNCILIGSSNHNEVSASTDCNYDMITMTFWINHFKELKWKQVIIPTPTRFTYVRASSLYLYQKNSILTTFAAFYLTLRCPSSCTTPWYDMTWKKCKDGIMITGSVNRQLMFPQANQWSSSVHCLLLLFSENFWDPFCTISC